MQIPQRAISTGWLFGISLFAVTVAATMWKRQADACREAKEHEHDLVRLDSDMG